MSSLEYIRPATLEEAIQLLHKGIPMGGGTEITPHRRDLGTVIDLSDLALDQITTTNHSISIGATAKLQALVTESDIPETLRHVCQLEAGWNIRNMATIGGLIKASDGRSPLLTVLLALNPDIYYEPDSVQVGLEDFLEIREHPQIITKVVFHPPQYLGYEQVARAPRDFPLVCAALAKFDQIESEIIISLGGYGDRPIRLKNVDEDFESIQLLARESYAMANDEWASGEYRSHVASTLVNRLLEASRS